MGLHAHRIMIVEIQFHLDNSPYYTQYMELLSLSWLDFNPRHAVQFQYERFFIKLSIFETTHNASNSRDVDALKFGFVKYDTFYNGQIQQDSFECLMMLM